MSRRSITKETMELGGTGKVWFRFPSEWYGIIINYKIRKNPKAKLFVGRDVFDELPDFGDEEAKKILGFNNGVFILQGQAFGIDSKGYSEMEFTLWLNKPYKEEEL